MAGNQCHEVGKAFGGSVGCRRAFILFVAEQLSQRLFFLGIARAMVGVSSSLQPLAGFFERILESICIHLSYHFHFNQVWAGRFDVK